MISSANKTQILNSFLENIACMSDEKYQEKIWVKALGPECDDIDDTICDFFDEDHVLKRYKEFGITEKQYELLIILRDNLRKFTDDFDIYSYKKPTEQLIQIPEWNEIVKLSKKVVQSFNYKTNNSNDTICE
jgi:hypothetical protein